MPAPNDASARVSAILRWLGLSGVVLLAAFIVDLAILLPASVDDTGPRGVDLAMLPGIVAMSACALWARSRAAVAAFAGAGALVVSTVLIRLSDAVPYTPLLANISLAETVAGFELVYLCVRRVRPGVAFCAVSSLVVACLLAVAGRSEYTELNSDKFTISLVAGLALLIAAVVFGLQGRRPHPKQKPNRLAELLRGQWPLLGGLSFLLFFELASAVNGGVRAFPLVLCSIAAAGLAVLASRHPVPAALGVSAVVFFSAVGNEVLNLGSRYPMPGGVPTTQIGAGMAVVAILVRYVKPARAWWCIGLLTAVVAIASLTNEKYGGLSTIRQNFVAASLLLGISVAVGMFLRSRDSERAQVVQSAVTDAQTSERMALARELHDVVAHHVTGIVVQAQAAKMMGGKDPKLAMDALDRIEDAGTEALAAMRRLVRSMRGDAPAGSSGFSEQATTDLAADLRRLVDGANHGVPTEVDLDLPRAVPQEVARSALRLVQESLTNIGKHAAGARGATVLAEIAGEELHLRIDDDGRGQDQRPAGGSGGYGLIGMRERVELLHGRLAAGPAPDGGWRVEAWLPLEGVE
ncbi:sensor histidine kinase [Amycolatopsis anabasis]|uniref:sensor histidine kinase n=1 Tax=Amycolatopsis anabasis TaxID=1840409 RepID=UPI001FE27A4A|nr:histidine kinase [Amycolatopsis anabasis]